MDYILIIDNREKELIEILHKKEYDIHLENLDIGDIQFVDLHTKQVMIVIERKTYSDLSASIKDGRYKEQKERLIHAIDSNVRKIILLEGEDTHGFTLPIQTIDSVIVNTLIRDNIHIYISQNQEHTIVFIENIMKQLPKYYEELQKEIIHHQEKTYHTEYQCKTKKKENITPETCFRNMLVQIPGISTTIAQVFVDKYHTMNHFVKQIETHGIEDLSNEKYGKNNRKVGLKVAEKIVLYLVPTLIST